MRLAAAIIALAVTLSALPAFAQDSEKVLGDPSKRPSAPGAQMTGAQEARLADAVRDVRDDFASSRTTGGIGDMIGGVIIGGLGGYIAYTAFEDDPADYGLGLFGLGIAGYGLNGIVSGIWKLAYATPQERIAQKLLDDPARLRASGMLFLEQEAYRARRRRFVGGTLSIITGLSAGLLLVPLLQNENTDPILLTLLGLTSGIQVLEGIFTLFGQSGPEKRYNELKSSMGEAASIQDFEMAPTVLAVPTDDGLKLRPGLAAGFRF